MSPNSIHGRFGDHGCCQFLVEAGRARPDRSFWYECPAKTVQLAPEIACGC